MRKFLLLFISIICLQASYAQHTVLIKQVNIIDVEKGTIIKNANVLIRDTAIASITTKESNLKADTIIDGNNRYLIPGLWDMHVHIWSDATFPLLLANGVTGVRDMFYSIQAIQGWREKIARKEITGPQIVAAAGPIVDGPKPIWPGSVAVKDAAQGKRAVDSLKNILHTDFIKVYSLLPRDAYFAIAEEAKKQHIPFAGHVPTQVTVEEAARAGQKSQEHLFGLLEAASDSADYYMQVLQGKIADTNIKKTVNAKQFLHRTYNLKKLQQVLQEIKKYDSWICPTITVNYSMNTNDTTQKNDPRLQYLAGFFVNYWKSVSDNRLKTRTPESASVFEREFEMRLKLIKPIFDAGIPILAGTDFPNPYCFPGFSLHNELEWLVKGGLTPAQALQTATINPARYLNLQKQYGTVSAGKMADLILLDENPLTNISNTQKIQAVFVHGKVFNRTTLNEMLEAVKKQAGN